MVPFHYAAARGVRIEVVALAAYIPSWVWAAAVIAALAMILIERR